MAALPLLAASLTSSPLLIATVTAAQALPWLTFGPFGSTGPMGASPAWRSSPTTSRGDPEISLLRDLYKWQKPISTDALTERAIRGDHSLLVDIESVDPETTSVLLSTAASFGRWAPVEEMIDRGVRPTTTGRTPAHTAAGAGELDLLRKLVDHGADLGTRDPDLDAPE